MPVLNHHIVATHSKEKTAAFYSELLGLPQPMKMGEFAVLRVSKDTTLDFVDNDGDFDRLHYAFLVTEAEFDEIFARIQVLTRPYGSGGTEAAHPHPLIAPVIDTPQQGLWS
ncbi:VOC family protein [Streptomyces sp. HC44]|uniref:VOC family protein n=1 Tax=Streptomyces scabichelini TaxID=2711217 RepID=A0A6G4V3L0_9ACTN|nr:VOC family protein [Streptomyces scabichelini]NGO08515.1 VOC family protein [Streptomyces scabichelini]